VGRIIRVLSCYREGYVRSGTVWQCFGEVARIIGLYRSVSVLYSKVRSGDVTVP